MRFIGSISILLSVLAVALSFAGCVGPVTGLRYDPVAECDADGCRVRVVVTAPESPNAPTVDPPVDRE